jgi:3D-(3,5/4)-trihydroxycyclohexane-1,2-dione acylhydrolase (decyclizing)
MGYEIAGALGIKMARPERNVIAFVGDGSYLMLHTEIVTAVQEGVKLTIVLVDNHGYGCIHGLQRGCGGNSFGNEFRVRTHKTARLEGAVAPIDCVKNAESLGATAVRAENVDELRAAPADATKAKGVHLIYVQVPAEVRLPGYPWRPAWYHGARHAVVERRAGATRRRPGKGRLAFLSIR